MSDEIGLSGYAALTRPTMLRLRVQDIDASRNEILVRDGKGAKDRITCNRPSDSYRAC